MHGVQFSQFCSLTCKYNYEYTVIHRCFQNDGSGFSVDQLKGKQLSLTFQQDVQVVFRAKVKLYSCKNYTT